ncbi:molybdenum cofactor biosynthesis protein MoaE, partial [Aestuariivirga sp.]|uniref:molybdenum cofactor biosynthesis protein MoaE n=1 Tax=Aestuariivirga sp. TaxID=2650926 RepID=UPI0039188873
MIRVQEDPFDAGAELAALKAGRADLGGTVMFLGTVRDISGSSEVRAMTLEHYPGMTEKTLAEIEAEALR